MSKRSGPDGPTAEAVPRRNLRQELTARILAGVFQGRFTSGQRLVVQSLAELYGVSPTPVRESLVELAALGIVELSPNRGGVVLPFGPEQVREISQVRRVLEVEATRCASGRADRDALAALHNELARLQSRPRDARRDRAARDCDTRLHSTLAASCGSARLNAEIERYLALFRTLRDESHLRDAATNYARSDDVPEHLEILDGLLRGDPDAAADAMDRHIRRATAALEDVLFSAAARPSTPKAPARSKPGSAAAIRQGQARGPVGED